MGITKYLPSDAPHARSQLTTDDRLTDSQKKKPLLIAVAMEIIFVIAQYEKQRD